MSLVTNLVGIVVVAGMVFICHGYGHWKRALLGLALVTGLSLFIVQPLSDALDRLYVKNAVLRVSATLPVLQPELFSGSSKLESATQLSSILRQCRQNMSLPGCGKG